MSIVDRTFQISDGLASLAGKKIKAAVSELQNEKVITPAEAKKILSGMSKAKKNIYDSVSRELKKVLSNSKAPATKKSKSKKKKS